MENNEEMTPGKAAWHAIKNSPELYQKYKDSQKIRMRDYYMKIKSKKNESEIINAIGLERARAQSWIFTGEINDEMSDKEIWIKAYEKGYRDRGLKVGKSVREDEIKSPD